MIYADYQATTPLDPRVFSSMVPYMTTLYGNPHSRSHRFGWDAEHGVNVGRMQVAALINADPKEIIFTSGATESNNLALKGVVNFLKREKKNIHVITTQIEHKCVLDTCRNLEMDGVRVTYVPVNGDGIVDVEEIEKNITEDTVLVSVMAVNNEVGSVQPLKQIGELCRKKNVYFHTDAAQAVGKIPIDVEDMKIDLMSISSHKMYGPKGIGALYIRRKPRVRLTPLINGGGQERGLRSGTLAPFLVAGFGKASEIAKTEMHSDFQRISKLATRLFSQLKSKLHDIIKNSADNTKEKLKWFPGCLNLSFPHIEGESLMMKLPEIALSSGSACTSSTLEPSYVLRALKTNNDLAHSSIRFGIGKYTTKQEIDTIAKKTIKAVKQLKEMSPLYEMEKEGINLKEINWNQE